MLQVKRFINDLMTSNCYMVYDDDTRCCIVIDPGSEKSLREIEYIRGYQLHLDYIIITHEHTDHNWGVNALRDNFPDTKLICTEACNKYVKKTSRAYFLLYYDNPNYRYEIAPADVLITNRDEQIRWGNRIIKFILTPGHSYGSMCIDIDGMLFTGDTIMPFKPYFNGRDSNKDNWNTSIQKITNAYSNETIIYPGHGEMIVLGEWMNTIY